MATRATTIDIVSKAASSNRLAHAYLILCQDSSYAAAVLKDMAKLLLCKSPSKKQGILYACKACTHCIKVEKDAHPDLLEIKPQGVSIRIEQIRALHQHVRFAPLEAKRRVVLIHNIEQMNQSAANALLKILEEPPGHTYLLLFTTDLGRVLPTIKSRCQVLIERGHIYREKEVPEALSETLEKVPAPVSHFVLNELFVSEPDALLQIIEVRNKLFSLLTNKNLGLCFLETSAFVASSPQKLKFCISILGLILRDLFLLKGVESERDTTGIINEDHEQLLDRLAQALDYDTLTSYEKRLRQAEMMLERNVRPEMIADFLLLFWLKRLRKIDLP